MKINPFNVGSILLEELAAPVLCAPTLAPLEDVSEFAADDSALVTTALELERPVIDVVVPVAVKLDLLESAVLAAPAEPPIDARNGEESSSEVTAGIDPEKAVTVFPSEAVPEVAASVKEPAVISTR